MSGEILALKNFIKYDYLILGNGLQFNVIGPLYEFLSKKHSKTKRVAFPLFPHENLLTTYCDSMGVKQVKSYKYLRPPVSYIFDPIISLFLSLRADLIISFNPFITLLLVLFRKIFTLRTKIIQWHLDYSHVRFNNIILDKFYFFCDYWSTKACDLNIEVSEKAKIARTSRYGILHRNNQIVIDIGVDTRFLKLEKIYNYSKVVFVGNLRKGQGIETALKSIKILSDLGINVVLHVIGTGIEINSYKELAKKLSILNDKVIFHGELDKEHIDNILIDATIGIIPYNLSNTHFTYYSDPSKLKEYYSHRLIVIGTDFSDLTKSLISKGIYLVMENEQDLAKQIKSVLKNEIDIQQIQNNIMSYVKQQSWENKFLSLEKAVESLY